MKVSPKTALRSFGSDNHSGVHPKLMQALVLANQDHAPAYGTDDWSQRATLEFQKLFGTSSETFFVFNGTAANVTALSTCVRSFESVLCSAVSHLNVDECGAPEFFTGAKLLPLEHTNGILDLGTLTASLVRRGDQHFSQARVVSLTQPTEYGTCYSVQQIRDICSWAHQEKLFVHIDGARLANAVVALKTSFKEMLTETGVDVVSFGGTKNGLMFGEAVVFLNPTLAESYKYIRKQSAQLPSKTRFVAAQFLAYIKDELWRDIAQHSLAQAQKLRISLEEIRQVEITTPTQSNAVFVRLPKPWIKPLREHSFFYVWNEKTFECRLMTSWDTSHEDIESFVRKMKELAK
ncbi:MAG: threonine aldolase family protein [Bdellovibrio sp.]